MMRVQASRTLKAAAATRSTQLAARSVVIPHARTYATIPDPTHPTDKPKPSDKPSSGPTFAILLAGTAAIIGGWYALQPEDPAKKRIRDQQELEQKAKEAKEAGIATAHSAVREGEAKYDETKAAGLQKLQQAREEASSAATDARGKLDSVKNAATATYNDAARKTEATYNDAARKAEATYADAKHKAFDAAHAVEAETQSWGQWVGSWFGYGKMKTEKTAEQVKSEAAAKVAEGAGKVEREAQKRA